MEEENKREDLITIVIPVYKVEKYLEKSINSVINQTYQNLEIILSFVVLVCIVLIVRRKLIGALIYLLAYGMYFGVDVINNIQTVLNGASMETALNVFISIIGIILPIAVLADLLLDKGRKANPKDKKTDWFYNNEQFDRKLDERSDKNNYRTL